jgi:succinate dehydrogenase / fumarate reductase cytochrome b subunit
MSPAAAAGPANRVQGFFSATIVKKAVMAITGFILFGFVVGHLLGNLQVFLGPERLNSYAAFLKSNIEILWGARTVLLVSLCAHIVVTVQLYRLKNRARPVDYERKDNSHSTISSRSMYLTGPMIAAFVIYHLLDLTVGAVHPRFSETDVYSNVVLGFQHWPVSVAYAVAIGLLCLHLRHGIYSMFQTLGLAHPRYTPRIKAAATIISISIFIGYVAIPAAALTGILTTDGATPL